jgi:hypothetical protein
MNYEKIKTELTDYDKVHVGNYLTYLKFLETEKNKDQTLKNPWFTRQTEEQLIDVFKKVATDNVFIDGETITIGFRGKLLVTYNYQAYKNLVLNVYPETLFDMQNVHEGDTFSFNKESGKVIYSHKINNPFALNKQIIGTYCIIKNSRGEFLETLNMQDIEKMKAVATTKNIWNDWQSEMVLKSVIKRACKRHFRDIVVNVEAIDNESNDLERVNVEELIQEKIEKATSFSELEKIYKDEKDNVKDKVNFMRLLGEKKEALKELLPDYTTENEAEAIRIYKKYNKVEPLLLHWKMTDEQVISLLDKIESNKTETK